MSATTGQSDSRLFFSVTPLRYPRPYGWLIIVSTLDLVMTWIIIAIHGGTEANPVADLVLSTWGYWGLIIYKFALMTFVVVVCEIVARSRPWLARTLAYFGVAISAIPFFVALYLLYFSKLFAAQAPLF